MALIRVFVVSDNLLFCRGLKSLLAPASNVEIVGEESSIERAIQEIESLTPDVVIWGDSGTRDSNQPEEINLLKAKPDVRVIGLSMQNNDLFIYRASRMVVTGVKDLVKAIELDLCAAEASD